jgi:hypothetical protein
MRKCVPTVVAVAAFVAGAGPAAAAPGGVPGSLCALGAENAHLAIDDQPFPDPDIIVDPGPGASEFARLNPVEFGCTGRPTP